MNINQRGKFKIPIDYIEQFPEQVLSLFFQLKLIPIRAEYYYDSQMVEYFAVSENFEEVPPQFVTPDYQIIGRVQKINEEEAVTYYRLERITPNATGWTEPFTIGKVT
jgi:hypothetical protein